MRKVRLVRVLVISFSLLIGVSQPINAAETGKPDPTPTPFVSCGGIVCSYNLGKYFGFASVDLKSQAQVGDLGQFPCQVDGNSGTNFCRVFPENAVPSNNLNKVVLKGGYVEIAPIAICDRNIPGSCSRSNPLPGMKIVLTGDGATFDQYPVPGFSFSEDRKTLYIAKNAVLSQDIEIPRIMTKQIASITVTAFLEVNASEYSTTQIESGKILVKSDSDNFIFQRLTQQDLKKNPKIKIKLMQREITCAKGKTIKKVLKTNIYDIKCPQGYKIK